MPSTTESVRFVCVVCLHSLLNHQSRAHMQCTYSLLSQEKRARTYTLCCASAPTPRPPNEPTCHSSHGKGRPLSARLAHDDQGSAAASTQPIHGRQARPPSAPARSQKNPTRRLMSARAGGAEGSRCDISGADKHRGIASPLSSWGDSSRDSPVKSVVGAPANSARRERSFNSTGARMDAKVLMLVHELMNAQFHRLIALYPIRNNLLSGNARFWTIERCEQQTD